MLFRYAQHMRRTIATKNSIFKIHSLMYFFTIYYISQVNNDICMEKKY